MPTLQISLNQSEERVQLIHDIGAQNMKLRQVAVEWGYNDERTDAPEACLLDLSQMGASTSEILGYTADVQATSFLRLPRPGKRLIPCGGGNSSTDFADKIDMGYTQNTEFQVTGGKISFNPDSPQVGDVWEQGDIFFEDGMYAVDSINQASEISTFKNDYAADFGASGDSDSVPFSLSNAGADALVTFTEGQDRKTKSEMGYNGTTATLIWDTVTNTLVYGIGSSPSPPLTDNYTVGDTVVFDTFNPTITFTVSNTGDPSAIQLTGTQVSNDLNYTGSYTRSRVIYNVPTLSNFFEIGDKFKVSTEDNTITSVQSNTLTFAGSNWSTPSASPDVGDWELIKPVAGYITTSPAYPDSAPSLDAFFRLRDVPAESSVVDVSEYFYFMTPNLTFHSCDIPRNFIIRTYTDSLPMTLQPYTHIDLRNITLYFDYETNDIIT